MKNLKRYLALVLVFVFVFSLASCKKEEEKEEEKDPNEFTLSHDYLIVADSVYRNNSTISEAIEYLTKALADTCGVKAEKKSDSGLSLSEESYAFLIGDTKFDDSNIADGFKINDYAYKIKSENLIVINGGSTAATLEGVKHFCSEQLGYNGETPAAPSEVTLKAGTEYTYKGEYKSKTVSINGIPIEDFKIKINGKIDSDIADKLIQKFGKYNGFSIPVETYDSEVNEEGGVICLGALDRSGQKKVPISYRGYKVYVSDEGEYTIGIAPSAEIYYNAALNAFLNKIKTKDDDEKTSITFPTHGFQEFEYKMTEQYSTKWTLVDYKTKEMTVSDGLTYSEYYYTGGNGKPYRANVLYIDTDKYTFHNGTAGDRMEAKPAQRQTVKAQMEAAVANGLDIIAGVNGDYWYTGSEKDGEPIALTIKNGELLSRGSLYRGYFGVTKDGKPIIGEKGGDAIISNLQMAVGGWQFLLKDGMPLDFDMENEYCSTSHPRTLIGITEDGDVIIAVVDGREVNKGVSSGASMENCAWLMASLGAQTALNLDGGGSSTMVVKDGDEFVVKNNPSDGSPRPVINSILVVKKQS